MASDEGLHRHVSKGSTSSELAFTKEPRDSRKHVRLLRGDPSRDLPFGSGIFIAEAYRIPTRDLRRIFLRLDKRGSPHKPGRLPFTVVRDAIRGFHTVLRPPMEVDPKLSTRQDVELTLAALEAQAHKYRRDSSCRPATWPATQRKSDASDAMIFWDQAIIFHCFSVPLLTSERLFFYS